MKVRITDLPPAGLTIREDLPLAPLNARMREGTLGSDIEFTTPPTAVVLIKPLSTGAEIHGEVLATVRQNCGRCTEPKERKINVVVAYIAGYTEPQDEDSLDSNFGFIKILDGYVDFDEELYQALISDINLFWNPEQDVDARCSLCHKTFTDFNPPAPSSGRSMGALLDAALKKGKK